MPDRQIVKIRALIASLRTVGVWVPSSASLAEIDGALYEWEHRSHDDESDLLDFTFNDKCVREMLERLIDDPAHPPPEHVQEQVKGFLQPDIVVRARP